MSWEPGRGNAARIEGADSCGNGGRGGAVAGPAVATTAAVAPEGRGSQQQTPTPTQAPRFPWRKPKQRRSSMPVSVSEQYQELQGPSTMGSSGHTSRRPRAVAKSSNETVEHNLPLAELRIGGPGSGPPQRRRRQDVDQQRADSGNPREEMIHRVQQAQTADREIESWEYLDDMSTVGTLRSTAPLH